MWYSVCFGSLSSLRAVLAMAAAVLAVPAIQAQNCEGVTLRTQAEVDAFNCTDVQYLEIANTPIKNLDGLSVLRTIGSYLSIQNNNALSSADGLSSITSAGRSFILVNNRLLTSIDWLSNVRRIEQILIRNNDALTSLDGLESLTSQSFLTIEDNAALASLQGLSGITSMIPERGQLPILDISNNPSLTSLDGLDSLTSTQGRIDIVGNNGLLDVDGLANLTYVAERFTLRDNVALTSCTVGLQDLLKNGGIGGPTVISNNASGCNSVCEILGECTVDAEDDATPLVTALAVPYPNPTAGAASLPFTLAEAADVRLTVYDALGRRVATLVEGSHAAGAHEVAFGAGLPAGTYVMRFEAGGKAWTERVTLVR